MGMNGYRCPLMNINKIKLMRHPVCSAQCRS